MALKSAEVQPYRVMFVCVGGSRSSHFADEINELAQQESVLIEASFSGATYRSDHTGQERDGYLHCRENLRVASLILPISPTVRIMLERNQEEACNLALARGARVMTVGEVIGEPDLGIAPCDVEPLVPQVWTGIKVIHAQATKAK